MKAAEKYFGALSAALERAFTEQRDALEQVAERIFACLDGGGFLYLFGTGHAHILAEELFYRAGGLAGVYPILDEKLMLHISASQSTQYERTPGYALSLLSRYPVKAGDVMIVCSNSGRNAAPVEMAIECRKRGVFVVALTNTAHSQAVSPNNPYGKKLLDEVDVALDNFGAIGDAALNIGGQSTGATSTAVGAAILQALTCRAAEIGAEKGHPLDRYVSSNVEGGDAANEEVIRTYRPRIHCL